MPGHSDAFIRAFRHDMQSKEGMAILKLLMDEVCEVFEEVPYLHIGTDEVKVYQSKVRTRDGRLYPCERETSDLLEPGMEVQAG